MLEKISDVPNSVLGFKAPGLDRELGGPTFG